MGLGHDKANADVNRDSIYKDGHGMQLKGVHTIMAYPNNQHPKVSFV
jgi:hypothetical protein